MVLWEDQRCGGSEVVVVVVLVVTGTRPMRWRACLKREHELGRGWTFVRLIARHDCVRENVMLSSGKVLIETTRDLPRIVSAASGKEMVQNHWFASWQRAQLETRHSGVTIPWTIDCDPTS